MSGMSNGPKDVWVIREDPYSSDLYTYSAKVGGAAYRCLYRIEPGDAFAKQLTWYLDEYPQAPLLENKRADYARKAIVARGIHLWQILATAGHVADPAPIERCGEIQIAGSDRIFSQPWEILRLCEDAPPLATTVPIIRLPVGSIAYSVRSRKPGLLRVLLISARMAAENECIPPRCISMHFARKKWLEGRLEFQLVEPGSFRHVLELLELERDLKQTGAFDVLHIDAHGELLDHATLYDASGDGRRDAEGAELLKPIPPYAGQRGFVMLEGRGRGMPLSGQELAGLARANGIRIVVLNACRAAAEAAAGSVVVDLIRGGVPEVVAFRHKIHPRGAELFVHSFYDVLATTLSVPAAVVKARLTMYRDKVRRSPDGVPSNVDDWTSLVHYRTEHVAMSTAQPEVPTALPDEVIEEKPPADILDEWPLSWEWHVRRLYGALERGGPPVIVYGMRGAAPDFVVERFIRWIDLTSSLWPPPAVAEADRGLAKFWHQLAANLDIELPTGGANFDDVVNQILRRSCEQPHVFAFIGIREALDSGAMTTEEAGVVYELARELGANNAVIVTDSLDPLETTRPPDLRQFGPWRRFYVEPLSWHDIADWNYFATAAPADDFGALSRILVGIMGGSLVPLLWVEECRDAQQLEAILDLLVLHAGENEPEMWTGIPQVCQIDINASRMAITSRLSDAQETKLAVLDKLAIAGPCVTWTHLAMLEIDGPVSKEPAKMVDVMYLSDELARLSLARQVNRSEEFQHRLGVYQFDPMLRHCLRCSISIEEARAWDRSHHELYAEVLSAFSVRFGPNGRAEARDLLMFDIGNILIALWRGLRGRAPLQGIIEGFVDAFNASVWPARLDLRDWLVQRLCDLSNSADLNVDRRADLVRSLAVLSTAVEVSKVQPLRQHISHRIARLPEDLRQSVAESVDGILKRSIFAPLEIAIEQIDAVAQKEGEQTAFVAAIDLGEQLRRRPDHDPSDAAEAYAKALELGRKLKSPSHQAIALYGLGLTQIIDGRVDLAEKTLRKALSIANEHGPELVVAESNYELGVIFERTDLTRSKLYYRQAIASGRSISCVSVLVHAHQNWANIELLRGEPQVAADLLDQADTILCNSVIGEEDRAEEQKRSQLLRTRIVAALTGL